MPVAQRRQAERAVRLRVLLVADPGEAASRAGPTTVARHLLLGQPAAHHVLARRAGAGPGAPRRRRSSGRTSPRRAPTASAGGSGTACGPSRPVRWRADGRWRDGQIQTSVHAGGIASDRIRSISARSADALAVRARVDEAFARAPPRDAGLGVVHVPQTRDVRGRCDGGAHGAELPGTVTIDACPSRRRCSGSPAPTIRAGVPSATGSRRTRSRRCARSPKPGTPSRTGRSRGASTPTRSTS